MGVWLLIALLCAASASSARGEVLPSLESPSSLRGLLQLKPGSLVAPAHSSSYGYKHDHKPHHKCPGAITAVYCKESKDGQLTDIAYLNDKTGLHTPGCGGTAWLSHYSKAMWLADGEAIIKVSTCQSAKPKPAFSSITFITDGGQKLTCGNYTAPHPYDSTPNQGHHKHGYGKAPNHPYTAAKSDALNSSLTQGVGSDMPEEGTAAADDSPDTDVERDNDNPDDEAAAAEDTERDEQSVEQSKAGDKDRHATHHSSSHTSSMSHFLRQQRRDAKAAVRAAHREDRTWDDDATELRGQTRGLRSSFEGNEDIGAEAEAGNGSDDADLNSFEEAADSSAAAPDSTDTSRKSAVSSSSSSSSSSSPRADHTTSSRARSRPDHRHHQPHHHGPRITVIPAVRRNTSGAAATERQPGYRSDDSADTHQTLQGTRAAAMGARRSARRAAALAVDDFTRRSGRSLLYDSYDSEPQYAVAGDFDVEPQGYNSRKPFHQKPPHSGASRHSRHQQPVCSIETAPEPPVWDAVPDWYLQHAYSGDNDGFGLVGSGSSAYFMYDHAQYFKDWTRYHLGVEAEEDTPGDGQLQPAYYYDQVAPLAAFEVDCKGDGCIKAIHSFCWNEHYNNTRPDGPNSTVIVELPPGVGCPKTPQEIQKLYDSLAQISTKLNQASGGIIGYIDWGRYTPAFCQEEGMGLNTTITLQGIFVTGPGHTYQEVVQWLNTYAEGDLCNVDLQSISICENSGFSALPYELSAGAGQPLWATATAAQVPSGQPLSVTAMAARNNGTSSPGSAALSNLQRAFASIFSR